MKLTLYADGTWSAECEGDTQQELWKQAAMWHSLPTVCPVDDTPVRFGYKEAGDYKYFTLLSTGADQVYEYPIGVGMDGRGLFPGKMVGEGKNKKFVQRWVYYDHDKKEEVVVWENGRLLIEAPSSTHVVVQAQPTVVVEHRNITDPSQLDAMLDEAEELDFNTIPGAVTDAQKIEALGVALSGNKEVWATKIKGSVMAASKQRTHNLQQLDRDETEWLLLRLQTKVREAYDDKASALFEAKIPQPDVDPDNLEGLALADAYTKLCKIAEKVPA